MEREGMDKVLWQLGIAFIAIGTLVGLIIGFSLKINFGAQALMLDDEVPSIAHPYRWAYGGITIGFSVFFGSVLLALSEMILKSREKVHTFEQSMANLKRLLKDN
ncbi:hypothetical protein MM326_06755 [Alkalihalobacillus sp. LMS6]|uniref:hypothetical protein n=1 Tax=Alkalihalobacillus sp. LMS6 TaxID=2924034 RepID=UPI0020D110EC|nr:hypothetical protein [Alkalihalobacillus sp. LMS6]UTR07708.1 hypothetical protein MM326_06755 [Alkalihalobacillus sp. LMS6]